MSKVSSRTTHFTLSTSGQRFITKQRSLKKSLVDCKAKIGSSERVQGKSLCGQQLLHGGFKLTTGFPYR